jgi:hypothetical protein
VYNTRTIGIPLIATQKEIEMTDNTNITNSAETFQLGKEAARRWNLSAEHGDAGDANAIVALVHAQRVLTFNATVERKKDDTAEQFEFDILSFSEPYWNNDGSKDTRKMAARTACLAERLFGITDITNATKQRIARTVKCAVYLLNACSKMTDEELFAAIALKGNKLVVPYDLVKAEPSEDASDNDKAFFAAMKGKPLVLDGKDKNSLAELSRRANPPSANRAAGEDKTKGASFTASLHYVTAIVQQQMNTEADESDIALSSDARRELFKLSQYIAAYFAADPMEEDELSEPEAKTGTDNK